MTDGERGALLREYPRTFSVKNWPFFVFLVFLGGVLATFAYVAGNPLAAVLLMAGALVLPVPFFFFQRVLEQRRATLYGLYERGLLVDFKGETVFLSWDSFVELRTWRQRTDAESIVEVEQRVVQLTSRSGVVLALSDVEVLKVVEGHVRLTPIDEGLKRW